MAVFFDSSLLRWAEPLHAQMDRAHALHLECTLWAALEARPNVLDSILACHPVVANCSRTLQSKLRCLPLQLQTAALRTHCRDGCLATEASQELLAALPTLTSLTQLHLIDELRGCCFSPFETRMCDMPGFAVCIEHLSMLRSLRVDRVPAPAAAAMARVLAVFSCLTQLCFANSDCGLSASTEAGSRFDSLRPRFECSISAAHDARAKQHQADELGASLQSQTQLRHLQLRALPLTAAYYRKICDEFTCLTHLDFGDSALEFQGGTIDIQHHVAGVDKELESLPQTCAAFGQWCTSASLATLILRGSLLCNAAHESIATGARTLLQLESD